MPKNFIKTAYFTKWPTGKEILNRITSCYFFLLSEMVY